MHIFYNFTLAFCLSPVVTWKGFRLNVEQEQLPNDQVRVNMLFQKVIEAGINI